MIKHFISVSFAFVVCMMQMPSLFAETPAAREFKADLSTDSFQALYSLVRPQENEWRHLKVKWLTDVVTARKRAAAEDKPIIICYTGGAG